VPDQSLTCAQLDAQNGYLSTQLEKPAPDHSGSVLIDCRWHPSAGATRVTGCDGPIFYLRVRNNSPTKTARALLPNKKAGNPWLDGAPGTDVILDTTVRQADQNTLDSLGLTTYADVSGVRITWLP
jgi:hypothetical protein